MYVMPVVVLVILVNVIIMNNKYTRIPNEKLFVKDAPYKNYSYLKERILLKRTDNQRKASPLFLSSMWVTRFVAGKKIIACT